MKRRQAADKMLRLAPQNVKRKAKRARRRKGAAEITRVTETTRGVA